MNKKHKTCIYTEYMQKQELEIKEFTTESFKNDQDDSSKSSRRFEKIVLAIFSNPFQMPFLWAF